MGKGQSKSSSKEIINYKEEQEVPQVSKMWKLLAQRTRSFFEPYITDRFEAHLTVGLTFFHRCLDTVSTSTITDGSFGSKNVKLIWSL